MFPIAALFVVGGGMVGGILAGNLLARNAKSSSSWLQPTTRIVTDKQSAISASPVDLPLAGVTAGLAIAGAVAFPGLYLLTIPLMIYLSRSLYVNAYRQLFIDRQVKMAVLDGVISALMIVFGFYLLNSIYLFLYLVSARLIDNARLHSMDGLVNVFKSLPQSAWVLVDGVEAQRPLESLDSGDVIVIHAGETIPADGRITAGNASIDQHMLTGESQPAEKGIGDSVFAATIVFSGKIYISVERSGRDTVAAQIESILNNTASYHSDLELRGQQIADQFALPVLLAGGITLPLLGPSSAMAVLIADIGYRMRFIGPLSVLNHLTLVTKQSILVKDGRALESMQTVDTFVFDKTGTLTQDQPHVSQVHTASGYSEVDVIYYAAGAEYRQTHPIAKAILHEARERAMELPAIQESSYGLGYGLRVQIGGKLVRVGSSRFMRVEQLAIPAELLPAQERCHAQGHSLVYVAVDDEIAGGLELHATIRPEVKAVVADLRQRGMTLYIISGDHEEPTRRLAEELGIDHYFAQVLPEDKADLITKLQDEGKQVCFVGDGINDSIALKKANVAVSLSGASTIATDTAQVVLMDGTLNRLIPLYDLSKGLQRNMNVNFMSTLIPGLMVIGGVYFLQWGILTAQIIGYTSFMAGVGNSFLPALRARWQTSPVAESD